MNKKIITRIFLVFIIMFVGIFIYQSYKFNHPKSTGAILTEVSINEIKLGGEVATLKKLLPYSRDGFTITLYDYAKSKFVVNITDQDKFDTWLLESEFKDIPPHSFLVLE